MYKKYCRTGPIVVILLCQNFSIISSCSLWESSVSRILRRALCFFLEGFPGQISLFIRYLMCPPGTVTPIFWLSLASKPSWWYLVSYREKFPCRLRYPRGQPLHDNCEDYTAKQLQDFLISGFHFLFLLRGWWRWRWWWRRRWRRRWGGTRSWLLTKRELRGKHLTCTWVIY